MRAFKVLLRVVLLAAAVAIGAVSVGSSPGAATDLWPYPHSCYAGCCMTCQGGLCCYDQPTLPDRGTEPLPNLPSYR